MSCFTIRIESICKLDPSLARLSFTVDGTRLIWLAEVMLGWRTKNIDVSDCRMIFTQLLTLVCSILQYNLLDWSYYILWIFNWSQQCMMISDWSQWYVSLIGQNGVWWLVDTWCLDCLELPQDLTPQIATSSQRVTCLSIPTHSALESSYPWTWEIICVTMI